MNQGILASLAAYFLFSTGDATIKLLGPSLPVFEILFFIMAFHLVSLPLARRRSEPWRAALQVKEPRLVAVRVACAVIAGICSVTAFTTLPFAEAYALLFLMPVFTTLLSIPLLGEEVGWRRGMAVLLGFAGVILVVRPGFQALTLGHLAALGGAASGAISMITLRRIGSTENRVTLLGAMYIANVVVNGLLMVPHFVMPTPTAFAMLAFVGVVGSIGQVLMIAATRRAPASQVATTQYSQIVWAVVFGMVVFNEWPDALSVAGMAMVGLSGLITLRREVVRHGLTRRELVARVPPDEI